MPRLSYRLVENFLSYVLVHAAELLLITKLISDFKLLISECSFQDLAYMVQSPTGLSPSLINLLV
jgi:hypothetical protein